jgi:hypothetical protein
LNPELDFEQACQRLSRTMRIYMEELIDKTGGLTVHQSSAHSFYQTKLGLAKDIDAHCGQR